MSETPNPPRAACAFTPQQGRVVQLMAQGMRSKEIAAAMGLTEGTVKQYKHAAAVRFRCGTRELPGKLFDLEQQAERKRKTLSLAAWFKQYRDRLPLDAAADAAAILADWTSEVLSQ